jgi:hypothetical protein
MVALYAEYHKFNKKWIKWSSLVLTVVNHSGIGILVNLTDFSVKKLLRLKGGSTISLQNKIYNFFK